MPEDTNIDDLKRQLEHQMMQSKGPARMVSEGKSHMFTGQTMKTGGTIPMELGDIASVQQQSRVDSSQVTGTFPTSEKQGPAPAADDEPEPSKPSCFEEQVRDDIDQDQPAPGKAGKSGPKGKDKDSEDAESFDDEKQKSMVLNELGIEGLEDPEEGEGDGEAAEEEPEDGQDGHKDEPAIPDVSEDKVSEKSGEDEDEKRKKEIQEKTMANVIDYDEWLEKQTQKEIERLSQIERQSQAERQSRVGFFSPKSTLKIPEKGILKLKNAEPADGTDRKRNTFTQQLHSEAVADPEAIERAPTAADPNRTLAEAIQEQTSRQAARPKTRGDPITFGLD